MKGPSPELDISDRVLECEFELEPLFIKLLEVARSAGWTKAEIALALCNLSDNFLLGQVANAKTADAVYKAIANLREK